MNVAYPIYDNKVEITNGRAVSTNSDYIELITPGFYEINEVIDGKYLVVGHSDNSYYYLNKEEYINSYLNLPSMYGKVLYSNNIREDKTYLTINSINYKDIYSDQEVIIAQSKSEFINNTNFIKNTLSYASIIVFFTITIIGLIKLSDELRLRSFSLTRIKRNIMDLTRIIIEKSFKIVLISIFLIKVVTLIINYIYNYSIKFNYTMFFAYIVLLIGVEILLSITMTLYMKFKRF